jgi:rubrerythrin
MNTIGLAKEIEQQGYEHYLKLAEATPVREISGIFQLLAREELRHLEIFSAIEKERPFPPVEDSETAGHAKKVFESMADHFKTAGVPAFNHDDALEKALQFEQKSITFYSELLEGNESAGAPDREVLNTIIAQERIHARLITSLMDFFRHPGEWLENAEWRHADEF